MGAERCLLLHSSSFDAPIGLSIGNSSIAPKPPTEIPNYCSQVRQTNDKEILIPSRYQLPRIITTPKSTGMYLNLLF